MSRHHHHSSGARSTTAAYQLNVTLRFTNDLPNGPYANLSGMQRTAEVFINQDSSRTLADVKQAIEATAAKVLQRDESAHALRLAPSHTAQQLAQQAEAIHRKIDGGVNVHEIDYKGGEVPLTSPLTNFHDGDLIVATCEEHIAFGAPDCTLL